MWLSEKHRFVRCVVNPLLFPTNQRKWNFTRRCWPARRAGSHGDRCEWCDKQPCPCLNTFACAIYMGSGKDKTAGGDACERFGRLKGCLAERRFCVSGTFGSLEVCVRAWRYGSVACRAFTESGDSWSGRARRCRTACGRFRRAGARRANFQ